MEQLEGFFFNGYEKKIICLSNHYMVWNKYLNNNIKNLTSLYCQMSLKSKNLITCLYKKTHKCYIIVYLYLDDMLILDSGDHMIKFTKKTLTNKFDVTNLDIANVILKIQIY
jgi:hypothetical protein